MLLKLDHSSTQPLHDQLAGQLRSAIANGELSAGEKLAPAKSFAAELGINIHTLLRAFQTLKDEGLLEMRRGRGTTVTGKAPKLAKLSELAQGLVKESRTAGLTNLQIQHLLKEHL